MSLSRKQSLLGQRSTLIVKCVSAADFPTRNTDQDEEMDSLNDANLAHQRPAIYVRVNSRHSAVLREQGCVCFQQQLPTKAQVFLIAVGQCDIIILR